MSSHLQYIDTKGGTDTLYYNVALRYEDNSTGETIARFQEDRDIPIVNKADDWDLTIIRFNINAKNIPIFIMDVEPNPGDATDPNYSVYSVTMVYHNLVGPNLVSFYYRVNIVYVPYNHETVPAAPTATTPKNLSKYYWVHSYQHMLDMVNVALSTALTNLRAVHGAATQTLSPFFTYDKDDQLINLITQFTYNETITGIIRGSVQTINRLAVCVNDKLYNKCFEGIPSIFRGRQLTNGDDYEFRVYNEVGNSNAYALPGAAIPVPPLDPIYLIFAQEGVTLEQWNDLSDIVFASQTLPTVKEMIKSSDTNDGLPNYFSILTDFHPNLSTALSTSSILSYFADDAYRWINLTSPMPLRTFDFQIYWREIKTGRLLPIYLNYGDESTVKFMFKRRKQNTQNTQNIQIDALNATISNLANQITAVLEAID